MHLLFKLVKTSGLAGGFDFLRHSSNDTASDFGAGIAGGLRAEIICHIVQDHGAPDDIGYTKAPCCYRHIGVPVAGH